MSSYAGPRKIEIIEAFAWYEEQQKDLGIEFLNSVDKAMRSVKTNPGSYQLIHKNIRRVLLRRFPYALFLLLRTIKLLFSAVFIKAVVRMNG